MWFTNYAARVAQMAEHCVEAAGVVGPNPTSGTIFSGPIS